MVSQYESAVQTILSLAIHQRSVQVDDAYQALVSEGLDMAMGEHMSTVKLLRSLKIHGLLVDDADGAYSISHAGKVYLEKLSVSATPTLSESR